MKVIIAGSRTYQANKARQYVLDAINDSGWAGDITEIVHGGARGIDSASHDVCEGHWPVKVFPADWKKHGRAAGPIRNREMAQYADALIAVWDGKSRGTSNMISEMQRLGKPAIVLIQGGGLRMRKTLSHASLYLGGIRKTVRIARTPKYMRWVMVGGDWKTLDALDQLDDSPRPDETVYASQFWRRDTVHIDRVVNGKRVGEWHRPVVYKFVNAQPTQEVLRNPESWAAWCLEQEEKAERGEGVSVSIRRVTLDNQSSWCVYAHVGHHLDTMTCPDSIRTQAEAVTFAAKLWRVREQDVKVEEEVRDVSYCLPKGVKVGI